MVNTRSCGVLFAEWGGAAGAGGRDIDAVRAQHGLQPTELVHYIHDTLVVVPFQDVIAVRPHLPW